MVRLMEIRGDNIFENCQVFDWDGQIIPDKEKRIAVFEFVNSFTGFPERCMLTNEYAWPLRPEIKQATSPDRDNRVKSLNCDSPRISNASANQTAPDPTLGINLCFVLYIFNN